MEYNYSIYDYLGIWGKTIISYLVIIIFFALLTDANADPVWSFCAISVSCLLGLKLFYSLLLKNIGFAGFWIVAFAFIFKLSFGTWHFLTFVQPDYFNGNTTYSFFGDYFWMHESIEYLADEAKNVGFSQALTFEYFIGNKGAFIFYLYSPIYYFGGNLVLNLSPVSTVFTLFTAILITYMAKYFFNLSIKNLIAILVLTSFFPFGFIPSMTMRDFAGQFFLALGLISLQFSFKNSKLFFLIFISAILFFLQRKNYVVIPFITYIIFIFFYTNQTGFKKFSVYFNLRLLFLLATIFIGYNYLYIAFDNEVFDTETQLNAEYTADATSLQFYLLLPVYIFKGFLGPFPWSQFFEYKQETIYQLTDYFTSTFLFTILLTLWKKRHNGIKYKDDINVISISSLLLVFTGVASGFMHLTYIAIGVIFLIPFVMKHITLNYFLSTYLIVFLVLVALSMFWVGFGFYGGGSWQNFKN